MSATIDYPKHTIRHGVTGDLIPYVQIELETGLLSERIFNLADRDAFLKQHTARYIKKEYYDSKSNKLSELLDQCLAMGYESIQEALDILKVQKAQIVELEELVAEKDRELAEYQQEVYYDEAEREARFGD